MSKGYITIAQNSHDVDYLTQAYALALSIKNTQSEVNSISVVVDDPTYQRILPKHKQVFDNIIIMPWQDDALDATWKVNNKWKVYFCTPYHETVLLDSDMIFPTDVSHWWPMMSQQDFWSTTQTLTFQGDPLTTDKHRKVFVENNLPMIHNAFMYFKKSEIATEIFQLSRIIFQNWQRFYHLYLPNSKPSFVSGDVVFALAIKILGYEHFTTRENISSVPTFVHMRGELQGGLVSEWSKYIPSYVSQSQGLVVGNFRQSHPFHYVDDSWLTSEIVEILEGKHASF